MCLAKAYLNKKGDEPVLEGIVHVLLHDNHVAMATLLGEEKVIPGRVVEIDFSKSKIMIDESYKPRVPVEKDSVVN